MTWCSIQCEISVLEITHEGALPNVSQHICSICSQANPTDRGPSAIYKPYLATQNVAGIFAEA